MEDIKSLEIPGRICLMGDKVDLLGKPVIAMAINLMMRLNYIAIEKAGGRAWTFEIFKYKY